MGRKGSVLNEQHNIAEQKDGTISIT